MSPSATATTPAPTFSLSGTVTDSTTGHGISGATVKIANGPNSGKAATTDGSGNYSLAGLQPSGFEINVSANYYLSQTKVVTLGSNQTLSFRLTTGTSLTGQVTDGTTSAPIAGITVVFSFPVMYATTDGSGHYTLTGLPEPDSAVVWASDRRPGVPAAVTDNYEPDFRYYRSASQNFHLFRINRITAGDSTVVTVAPDDTLCVNNVQDEPGAGPDYVCRSVRVVAPSDGILTVEAVSTQGGSHPPLEVETVGVASCCSERIENPTSIKVTAGTEVVVHVEMLLSATASQSFVVNTSMSRP